MTASVDTLVRALASAHRSGRAAPAADLASLSATIAAFPVSRLEESRPGVNDTWYGLLVGELQHVLYHAGQVALLRKAQGTGKK